MSPVMSKKKVEPKKARQKVRTFTKGEIQSGIAILTTMKDSIFGGDHPGIDQIVLDMQIQLKGKK